MPPASDAIAECLQTMIDSPNFCHHICDAFLRELRPSYRASRVEPTGRIKVPGLTDRDNAGVEGIYYERDSIIYELVRNS